MIYFLLHVRYYILISLITFLVAAVTRQNSNMTSPKGYRTCKKNWIWMDDTKFWNSGYFSSFRVGSFIAVTVTGSATVTMDQHSAEIKFKTLRGYIILFIRSFDPTIFLLIQLKISQLYGKVRNTSQQ